MSEFPFTAFFKLAFTTSKEYDHMEGEESQATPREVPNEQVPPSVPGQLCSSIFSGPKATPYG